MVSSLPKQFARKLFQVPFSRFGSLRLKLATEAEDAAFLLFPLTISQELAIAGHGWPIQAEVNTNHIRAGVDNRSRDIHNDMEE